MRTKHLFFTSLAFLSSLSSAAYCEVVQKKALFIVNPFAGNGKHHTLPKLLSKTLDPAEYSCQIAYTEKPKHATELAQKAVKEKYDLVVAVGGDGTVNEVAKALIGSQTTLGIIPCGSGNGLARHLNIPVDKKKALEIIQKSNETWIDTVQINKDFFLCVAGIGFDARISDAFSHLKYRGFVSYIKTVLQILPNYEPKQYHLIIDGKHYCIEALLISFANSAQYGNNAYIAPSARIDDGYLDITVLKKFPPYILPKLTYMLFNKKLDQEDKYIEKLKCKDVIIEDSKIELHTDGEPFSTQKPVHIRIMPASLKICAPPLN